MTDLVRAPAQLESELEDLVTLAALACRTPAAVLATFAGGELSTIRSYGLPQRAAPGAAGLVEAISARDGVVELHEPPLGGGHPSLASLRWACGLPVRAPGGGLRAVIAVLDKEARELAGPDRVGLMAVSRRLDQALGSVPETPVRGGTIDLTGRFESAATSAPTKLPVLRCGDVAEIFAVSERTVMKWAAEERIPSFRTAGGRLRFRHEDIDAFIDEHSSSMSGHGDG